MNGRATGLVSERDLLLVHTPEMCGKLEPTLASCGFAVHVAHTTVDGVALAAQRRARHAVIGLKLADASGLRLIPALLAQDSTVRVVVVTAYPSIETAVAAIKLGAVHYLAHPVAPQRLVSALMSDAREGETPVPQRPMSVHRVAWEYIHQVLHANQGNVSATARVLAIDRRTLQRKLRKHPARR